MKIEERGGKIISAKLEIFRPHALPGRREAA